MIRRLLLLLALTFPLAGCISSNNTLSPELVNSFRLVDVAVSFPADARLNYTRAEDELATSRGVSPNDYDQVQALARTPDGVTFIRDKARLKMQEAFRAKVGPLLHGVRPVRIEVGIKMIDVPGAMRSLVIGGTATLAASVKLVDVGTGQIYLDLPNQAESAMRGGGPIGTLMQGALESAGQFDEPYQRLCESLATDYAQWLRGANRTGA